MLSLFCHMKFMTTQRDPSSGFLSLLCKFPEPADAFQADIYREQHLIMARQLLPMGAINVIASLLVATSMLPHFTPAWAFGWSAPLVLAGLFQLWSWYKFRNMPEPEHVSGGFLRKAEISALAVGIIWGSAMFIFGGVDDPTHKNYIHLVQAGMAAGVVSLITPLPRHTFRFVVPCLGPVIVSPLLYEGESLMTVASLGMVFLWAVTTSSIDSYKQLRVTIGKTWESRRAQTNLVDAIESTKDAFAILNDKGEVTLSNKNHDDLFGQNPHLLHNVDHSVGVEVIKHNTRWLMRSTHVTQAGGMVLVHTDITALKRRERELVEARKEAVEADDAKSRFLSTMSEELRTPLNMILSFSRLMASDSKVELTWDEVAEYADNINESGAHLLNLVDDIIDYSKVGLDKYLIETSDVDIRSLIARTVSLTASFEHITNLSAIDVGVSPKLGLLRVDPSVVQRIVMHLLTNAIRFGGANHKIVLRAGLNESGHPFIAIRDFGEGMSASNLERVFEAFYQVDDGPDGGQGGTGLGLTLCRHLARLHDGDIVLASRVGVGTTATLVLPIAAHVPRELSVKPLLKQVSAA
jgi:signal transduction histidine kinase